MNRALSQYHNSPSDSDRHALITKHIHTQPIHPLFSYRTIFEQVMAWGDMDLFEHLNNVRYYEYAQSARIDHLARTKIFDKTYTVVVATSCKYQHSVHFPDTLWIGVKVSHIGNTSLSHDYGYFSTAQQRMVATGTSTIVHMNEHGQKCSFSEEQKIILATF